MNNWLADNYIQMEKEGLIEKAEALMGRSSPQMRVLLRVLSHPDIVESTVAYFSALDPKSMCLNHEAPWSCARESESRFENLALGWGAGADFGVNDLWCANCRRKVIGDNEVLTESATHELHNALSIWNGDGDDKPPLGAIPCDAQITWRKRGGKAMAVACQSEGAYFVKTLEDDMRVLCKYHKEVCIERDGGTLLQELNADDVEDAEERVIPHIRVKFGNGVS